ncbi:MAG TPA: GNAT family N-acetyltransferase [Longimicrobiales bacterium]|nr:GNAT family N-acetyltransferase [Longimicrobiales bacterium]
MDENLTGEVRIREASDTDASRIVELFRDIYGSGYVHPRFYDEREIRRMVFDEDTLVLVAEDSKADRIVGSASVLFEMGAYSDLVGEFGRLLVHPDWRGGGVGTRLMGERLARVGGRLHVAFAEVRVVTGHSARISEKHGFVPVGVLPQKLVFGGSREHCAFLVKHFGEALALRKNHPRIIPEAHHLAELALTTVGLSPDVVIDEDSASYPTEVAFDLERLSDQGYAALLRIERGRVRNREVFGPQRLHYGLSRLAASRSDYLVAREDGRIVGALGYLRDEVERNVRVFEVIHTQESAIRFLFEALERLCLQERVATVEVDVSAHAPRMQRTLLELGYLPNAYVPAMSFHDVERLDVVKMCRLFGDLLDLPFEAPEATLAVGRFVLAQFATRKMLPRLARAMDRLDICRELTQEQSARLLGEFTSRTFQAGERVFEQGGAPEHMILILEGSAIVSIDGEPVGRGGPGETLGEVSFLNACSHSASAVAETRMDVGALGRGSLQSLVRRRPDIGTVVYRNLARGLGQKLRRADLGVAARPGSERA